MQKDPTAILEQSILTLVATGPLTVVEVSEHLRLENKTVQNAVRNMVTTGVLVICGTLDTGKRGTRPYLYGLPGAQRAEGITRRLQQLERWCQQLEAALAAFAAAMGNGARATAALKQEADTHAVDS